MALTYTQVIGISSNTSYLQQIATAILKKAMAQINAAGTAEQALCIAIAKTPMAYAPRFLLEALLLNQASLTTSDGTTLTAPPSDAAIDTAINNQWAAQIIVGA